MNFDNKKRLSNRVGAGVVFIDSNILLHQFIRQKETYWLPSVILSDSEGSHALGTKILR